MKIAVINATKVSIEPVDQAVILSQMSQVRALSLFKDYPIPVLSSPSVSLGLLVEEINAIRNQQ